MEGKEGEPPKDLLVEPEEVEGEEKDEVSVAGAVAGVTVPMGAGPHYPDSEPGGRMPAWKANAKAFGNAAIGRVQHYKGKKKG